MGGIQPDVCRQESRCLKNKLGEILFAAFRTRVMAAGMEDLPMP
jgi:hypothetical protein